MKQIRKRPMMKLIPLAVTCLLLSAILACYSGGTARNHLEQSFSDGILIETTPGSVFHFQKAAGSMHSTLVLERGRVKLLLPIAPNDSDFVVQGRDVDVVLLPSVLRVGSDRKDGATKVWWEQNRGPVIATIQQGDGMSSVRVSRGCVMVKRRQGDSVGVVVREGHYANVLDGAPLEEKAESP